MHKHYIECVCHESLVGNRIVAIGVSSGLVGVVHHTPESVAAAIETKVGEFVVSVPPHPERALVVKSDGDERWVESVESVESHSDPLTVTDLGSRPECNGLDGKAHALVSRSAGVTT